MAKVLSRLDILLFANTAQYRREMRETQSDTRKTFDAIKKDAIKMGKVGGAVFAGLAASAAIGTAALIKEQVQLGNEIAKTARIANTGVEEIQKLTIASKSLGVEQDKLGDIYKDTQDKIGDFLSSGGGEMADFFESIAPQVGLTTEAFRELSGPDALQLYYDSLQQANIGTSEQIFYMESIADEASLLIPLLKDGGAGFDLWAQAAENAGAVMDAETIRATQELQVSTDLLMLSYDGAKNQFTQALLPVLSDVAGELVGTADASDLARYAGEKLAQGFKITAATGVGVVTIVKSIGTALGGLAAGIAQLGNGVDWNSPFAIFQIGKNFSANNKAAARVFDQTWVDIKNMYANADRRMEHIYALGTHGTNATVKALTDQRIQRDRILGQLGKTGKAIKEQAAAEDKAAKAAERRAKATAKTAANIQAAAVNQRVLAQVQQYNYGALEKQYGLPSGLLAAVSMQESRGNPNARSPVGAKGAFQFMPATAGRFGIRGQESDVAKSAEAAAKYFNFLLTKFGSIDKALAGYNAGEGNVQKYGGIPPFKETQNYVKKVKAYLAFMQHGIDGSININDTLNAQTAELERQLRDQRSIRLDYANEVARIEMQMQDKIAKIKASGFSAEEEKIFIADAQKQAAIDIKKYQDAQAKKLESFKDFAKSERELILQNAQYRIDAVMTDTDLTNEQQAQAIEAIKQQTEYELHQYQLTHDQQMQQAAALAQTEEDRIRNQYALERREIQLTINLDEELRRAKIDALNQAEQAALEELRYAHERELQSLTSYGLTELERIRLQFSQQRAELDRRTDIGGAQKSDLRNAIAGSEIYAVREYQKGVRDQFGGLQAELGGYSQQYQLQQQYQQRLDIIKTAVDAEVATIEQAEQAKYQARYLYEQQAQALMLDSTGAMLGNMTSAFKTMLGEQNSAYQILFAGQQAFVMATAGLNMYDAWSDAMAEGATLATKLASAATISAEFGKIISGASAMRLELPGFKVGGYTGSGNPNDIAGYAHKEEFVFDAPATKRIGVNNLERIRRGDFESNSGNNININVSVTVNADGGTDVQAQNKLGSELGNVIAAVAQKQIIKELNPGGEIYRRMR